MDEQCRGRLSKWYRRTPTSLEFWEVFITDQRVIWCFLGESFASLLLRADMGAHDRELLSELSLEEVAAFNERNFIIPSASLRSIHLRTGGIFRRATMTIEWVQEDDIESIDLLNTSDGDPQTDLIETLATDKHLSHVTVTVESPRFTLK